MAVSFNHDDLVVRLSGHKGLGNEAFSCADFARAATAYSDGLSALVAAFSHSSYPSRSSASSSSSAEEEKGDGDAFAPRAAAIARVMSLTAAPSPPCASRNSAADEEEQHARDATDLIAASVAARFGDAKIAERIAVPPLGSLLVTILSNRAACALSIAEKLTASKRLAEALAVATSAVEDAALATCLITAHRAADLARPCAVVAVPEESPLVPPPLRAKIVFRRARALRLVARIEQLQVAEVLRGASDGDYDSLSEVMRALGSANAAALDALTLLRKSVALASGAARSEAAGELAALRHHQVFPSAAFVHELLDKACGSGVVAHGVGIVVAAPAPAPAADGDVDTGTEGAGAGGGADVDVIPRGALLLREFPVVHVKETAGLSYEARFSRALEQLLAFVSDAAARGPSSSNGARAVAALAKLLSLHHAPEDGDRQDRGVRSDGKVKTWDEQGDGGGQGGKAEQHLPPLHFSLCDIWRRNAMKIAEIDFRIGEGNRGSEGVALYADASRFNHSCRPNAVQHFDFATGELSVRALRPLRPGEEVTIAYISPLADPQRKRELLRFECACTFCATTEADGDALGDRLRHIVCPHCGVTGDPLRVRSPPAEAASATTSASATAADGPAKMACRMCRAPVPLEEYLTAIRARRREATDLCLAECESAAAAAQQRTRALKLLLGIEDGARALGPLHHERFAVRFEALAAAVGAQLTVELSRRVVDLSSRTLGAAAAMLPSRWPLTTGLTMHHVFRRAAHASALLADVSRGPPLVDESARREVLVREPDLGNHICDAFEDHVVLTGDGDGALEGFWRRYAAELEAVGIVALSDFESILNAERQRAEESR